jgi:hypothetical protein
VTEHPYELTVTRRSCADAGTLFDIVADPSKHPVIDGSGTVRSVQGPVPDRLSLGATFGMNMKVGAKYAIVNTVVEFEEPNVIAWRHFNGHIWRYRFETVAGGDTQVTEQWDGSAARNVRILKLLRYPRRNRTGMVGTLVRLTRLAETGSADVGDGVN